MGISHENMAVLCGFSQRSYKCLLLTRSSSVTRALTISVRKGYSSLKNCVWNFQSGMQSGTHLRPVTWPSRSSELLLTAPTWSWWETQTSGRITRAGSCGWLPRRTWSLIIILIPTSLQNKSWNMFRLTQWRKSDGMDCVHALVQKCFIEFKEWVSVRKLKRGFPGHSAGKESACNAGDPILIPGSGRSPGEGIGHPLQYSWASLFDPWVGKIPWRRERLPTPVFWPGEFHGLYSPWSCKESATTAFPFPFQSETRVKHITSRWPRCCLFESELGNLFHSDFLMSPPKGLLPLWVSVSSGDTWGQTSGVPSSLPCAQTLRCIFLHRWAPSALLPLWFKWLSPGVASPALSFMWQEPLLGNLLISLLMSWKKCVNPFSHQLIIKCPCINSK